MCYYIKCNVFKPNHFWSNENCVEKQFYAESHIRTADKAIVDQHSHTCKLWTVVYVISIKSNSVIVNKLPLTVKIIYSSN